MPRKVEVDVVANTKNLQQGLADAGKATSGLQNVLAKFGPVGQAVSNMLGKLSTANISMAGAAGVGAAAVGTAIALGEKAIDMYVKLGQKVHDYAAMSGQTAEAASRQVQAFDALGIASDVAAAGMFKLSRQVLEHHDQLEALGVEIVKNKDGTVDLNETLFSVMNAYQATGDAVKRDALIFAAFGKAGAAMQPVLETNIAQLKQLEKQVGLVYTQKDLDAIRQYGIAQKQLKQSTDELGLTLGRTLLPAQLAAVESLNENIYVNTRLQESTKAGNQLMVETAHGRGRVVQSLSAEYKAAQDAKQATDSLAQAARDAADLAKKEADAEDALYNALHKNLDANFAYQHAMKNLNDAVIAATAAKWKDVDANLAADEAYVKVADSAVTLAEQEAEVAGKTLSASEKQEIWKAKLQELMGLMASDSPLRKDLQGYIDQLNRIPRDVHTNLTLSGDRPGGHGTQSFDSGGTVEGDYPGQKVMVQAEVGEHFSKGARGARGGGEIHIHIGHLYSDGPGLDALTTAIAQRLRMVSGI